MYKAEATILLTAGMVRTMAWIKAYRKNRRNEDALAQQTLAQEAEALWQRIREPEEYSALNDPFGASTHALGDISDGVRESLAQEAQQIAPAAAATFTFTHAKLMQAIEASTPLRRKPSPWHLTRWLGMEWAIPTARSFILATLLLLGVGMGGHQLGTRHAARVLPVQKLVDDFDAGLRSPAPFQLVADDPKTTESWLSQNLGMKVRLPAPKRAGVKLLGARTHHLEDRPVAQTHYLKGNVRVALYQMRAPRYGLPDLDEVQVHGRLYYTKDCGPYRAIVWRAGDNVMTMVSPLAMRESLLLASDMRDNTPHDITPSATPSDTEPPA